MISVDSKATRPARSVWLLLPVVMGLFQSSLIAATPTFISVTGLSTLQWSILLSTPTLLFLLLSPLWGQWADRHGARYLIRYSALGLGVSIIGLAMVWWLGLAFTFAPLLWLIAIGLTRITYGVSASGVMPLCQSLAISHSQTIKSNSDKTDNDQSLKNLGLVSASLSIGRLVGPLLLLLVLSQIDWLLAIYSIISIPMIVLIIRYSRKPHGQGDLPTGNNQQTAVDLKNVRPYLLMAFCVTLFVGYLQFVLGPLLLDWLNDSKQATMVMSLLLTVVATSALLCQILVVKRLNWQLSFLLPILSLALLFTALSLLMIDSVMYLTLMMIPVAFAVALLTPVYTRRTMAQYEQVKGQISGKLAVCHTAGYPIGSLLAGVYYPAFKSSWWLPLAVIAFVLLSASFTTPRLRPVSTELLYDNQ